jgi:hypothetical protein
MGLFDLRLNRQAIYLCVSIVLSAWGGCVFNPIGMTPPSSERALHALEAGTERDQMPTDSAQPVDDLVPDQLQPDTLVPDSLVKPDAGCPAGLVDCGGICVDLMTDFNHCGGCKQACPWGLTNECVAGACVCGKENAPCDNGLNCVKGACTCVAGGFCKGCCQGDTCVPVGSGQSATKCGSGGLPCKVCDDGNDCTRDTCLANGTCGKVPEPPGTSCDDSLYCTVNDSCSGGTCGGKPRDCSSLDDECNDGICIESKKGCVQVPKPDGTSCGPGKSACCNGVCYKKPPC